VKRLGSPRAAYWCLTGAVVLYAWGSLFFHLSKLWLGNDNYQYGWAAPFLLLFLVYRRAKRLPASSRPNSRSALLIAGFFACLMVPTRIVLETNPDWRILLWWSAALTIGFTLALIYDFGGWSYVKHFAFPTLFVHRTLRDGSFKGRFPRHFVPGYDRCCTYGTRLQTFRNSII
jgi:hypothetical protein